MRLRTYKGRKIIEKTKRIEKQRKELTAKKKKETKGKGKDSSKQNQRKLFEPKEK